jgi:hypothetical protein
LKDLARDAVLGYELVMERPATAHEKLAVRQAVSNALLWYLYDRCDEFKEWASEPEIPAWQGGEVYERLSRF